MVTEQNRRHFRYFLLSLPFIVYWIIVPLYLVVFEDIDRPSTAFFVVLLGSIVAIPLGYAMILILLRSYPVKNLVSLSDDDWLMLQSAQHDSPPPNYFEPRDENYVCLVCRKVLCKADFEFHYIYVCPVNCRYCNVSLTRSMLEDHVLTDCPDVLVTCCCVELGCPSIVKRSELANHESDAEHVEDKRFYTTFRLEPGKNLFTIGVVLKYFCLPVEYQIIYMLKRCLRRFHRD